MSPAPPSAWLGAIVTRETTIPQYRITNNTSGQTLGTYIGETCWEAIDAMARDAGYRNYLQACQETGAYDDLIVSRISEEVEED